MYPFVADNLPKLHELQYLEGSDKQVVRVIQSVATNWKKVALALKFDRERIDIIERDTFHKNEEASSEMLSRWLAGGHDLRTPVTWATLIRCLRETMMSKTAEKLKYICLHRKQVSRFIVTY